MVAHRGDEADAVHRAGHPLAATGDRSTCPHPGSRGDTKPQEGAFMERLFTFHAAPQPPRYCAAAPLTSPSPRGRKVHCSLKGRNRYAMSGYVVARGHHVCARWSAQRAQCTARTVGVQEECHLGPASLARQDVASAGARLPIASMEASISCRSSTCNPSRTMFLTTV